MIAAQRASSNPNPRQTVRHLKAFGIKVPVGVDFFQDFELPAYILTDDHAIVAGHLSGRERSPGSPATPTSDRMGEGDNLFSEGEDDKEDGSIHSDEE
jgi:hypothetical protein